MTADTHASINPQSLLRISQIIGDPKKGIPPLLNVSRSFFFKQVRLGNFPQPVRLTARCSVWKAEDILAIAAGK